jgi:hypothetical protein
MNTELTKSLTLWVRIGSGEVYSMQHYVWKFVSNLRQVGGLLRVFWFPPPLNWPPWYNWNIVESDVKHHSPNPIVLYNNMFYSSS